MITLLPTTRPAQNKQRLPEQIPGTSLRLHTTHVASPPPITNRLLNPFHSPTVPSRESKTSREFRSPRESGICRDGSERRMGLVVSALVVWRHILYRVLYSPFVGPRWWCSLFLLGIRLVAYGHLASLSLLSTATSTIHPSTEQPTHPLTVLSSPVKSSVTSSSEVLRWDEPG